jgi:hypothetical protein
MRWTRFPPEANVTFGNQARSRQQKPIHCTSGKHGELLEMLVIEFLSRTPQQVCCASGSNVTTLRRRSQVAILRPSGKAMSEDAVSRPCVRSATSTDRVGRCSSWWWAWGLTASTSAGFPSPWGTSAINPMNSATSLTPIVILPRLSW